MSEDSFRVSLDYPEPLKRILAQHSTKLSISRVVQYGAYLGYADAEDWMVSLYLIADVCRVCGLVRPEVGVVPAKEKCSRHSWDRVEALLLFHTTGHTAEEAMAAAGEQAERFNQDPKSWDWAVEAFHHRREYLNWIQFRMRAV